MTQNNSLAPSLSPRNGVSSRRGLQLWLGFVMIGCVLFVPAREALAQAVPKKVIRPTPSPTPHRVKIRQQELDEVYVGYARLFVLSHIMANSLGMEGVLPPTINLDFFAQQPLLAENGDGYFYPPSSRGDIMWPLIMPTPPRQSPTPHPTPRPTSEMVSGQEGATPTPTATFTPTPVVPPPLQLQAVSLSSTGSLVMIGEELLTVGDEISEAVITDIRRGFAKIRYYGAEFLVTNQGTIRPEDYVPEEFIFE